MRKIPLSAGLMVYLDELEFTEAALSADPDAAEYAQPFRDAIQEWSGQFASDRESRREVTRAEAVVAVANGQLDETTIKFGAEVAVEAGSDRKSTFFRRFFATAPSEFIRTSLRKQAQETIDKIVPQVVALDDKSRLKPYATSLKSLAKKAIDALDKRSKAKAARAAAGLDIEEWKEGANTLRVTTYADLLKVAATKGHGRKWADTFFRVESAEAEDEPAAPAPAAPAAPPAP